jgi:hypothetical protein
MVVRYEAIKSKVPFLLDRSRAYYSSECSIIKVFYAWRQIVVENKAGGKLDRMADMMKRRATLAQTFATLNKENFRNRLAQAKDENKKNVDRVTKEVRTVNVARARILPCPPSHGHSLLDKCTQMLSSMLYFSPALPYSTMLCCTMLILYYAVRYHTLLYCALLRYAVRHRWSRHTNLNWCGCVTKPRKHTPWRARN